MNYGNNPVFESELDLLNFGEVNIDWSAPAEEDGVDAASAGGLVDGNDLSFGSFERSMDDFDIVANVVAVIHRAIDHAHSLKNRFDLFAGDRSRLLSAARASGNTGDAWSVTNDIPRFVGHDHFDEDVAWIKVLGFGLAGGKPVFGETRHFGFGHEDTKDVILHVHGIDTLLEIVGRFGLVH